MHPFRGAPLGVLRASALLAVTLGPAVAHATDAKECADAYEQAQELRQAGSLRQARERLLVCTQDACPEFIQGDCATWLGEVESAMPSVVFVVRDADGNDLVDVTVTMGEDVIVDQLDGRAVNVNPGQQTFVFEIAGRDPIERSVLITQGEKNRAITIQLEPDGPETSDEPEEAAVAVDGADVVQGTPNRTLSYILGGVGVAGLGSFMAFAIIGKKDEDSIRSSGCAPNCDKGKVDDVHKKYVIADVSLGIGVVSLGLATYFFIKPPTSDAAAESAASSSPRVAVDVAPTPGGGFASVFGRF